ncbi:methylated-DNA--[protein]-cysteine S-methyltransferase [Fluviicola chungangensis]|uniref:methylated-DNA--[protein]-cysteine S-methyltransferase n=2 Tax=Fluviicola chungangensis TaxID=2597671 RepID=A0A556N3H4_9FLAO|nr:methylated-DNA--[protein]-cysteine S-methyltransferase [Fluviicola chungangensis]
MEADFSYQSPRMELLFKTLKWMLDSQQIGVTIEELSKHLGLGEWETQHLFQEYLEKDPIRFVQDAFSPSLTQVGRQQAQLSIFDSLDEMHDVPPTHLDLDIRIIEESPEEVYYSIYPYFLGNVFIASHESGLCQVTFEDSEVGSIRLKKTFPKSMIREERTELHELAYQALMSYFTGTGAIPVIPIAVKATSFQVRVWNELQLLGKSELTTYGALAQKLGDPNLSRAVGSAVGSNPVALLIPCHRVLHHSGKIGSFRWGSWRKQWLLAIEK